VNIRNVEQCRYNDKGFRFHCTETWISKNKNHKL